MVHFPCRVLGRRLLLLLPPDEALSSAQDRVAARRSARLRCCNECDSARLVAKK